MGWDRKRRGPASGYFYLSVRTSTGVKKIYLGRRVTAHVAADDVEQRREARRTIARHGELAVAVGSEAEPLRLEDDLIAWADALSSAWLILSGHHKHHGCWRKKRD